MKNTNVAILVVKRGGKFRRVIEERIRRRQGDDAALYEGAKALTILRLPNYATQDAKNLLENKSSIEMYFPGFRCTRFDNLELNSFTRQVGNRRILSRDQQAHLYEHILVPLGLGLIGDKSVAADIVWLSGSKGKRQYGIVINTEFPQREFKILTTMLWIWLGDTLLEGTPFPSIEQARSTLKALYRKPALLREDGCEKKPKNKP